MSSNHSMEKKLEQTLREKDEMAAQIKYLRSQLAQVMNQCHRSLRNSSKDSGESDSSHEKEDNPFSKQSESESNGSSRRYSRRPKHTSNDFRVDIPEYDGKLDPDEFLDWVQTVERVFDYKEVPEAKKVKIIALKLRKYASTWWSNVCTKRSRQGKRKIKTWVKMKKLMIEKFLPTYYLQENYSKLHHLKQGNKSVEEYTREFEHLLLKCDIREDEPQTLVRYLGGLDEKIAHFSEELEFEFWKDIEYPIIATAPPMPSNFCFLFTNESKEPESSHWDEIEPIFDDYIEEANEEVFICKTVEELEVNFDEDDLVEFKEAVSVGDTQVCLETSLTLCSMERDACSLVLSGTLTITGELKLFNDKFTLVHSKDDTIGETVPFSVPSNGERPHGYILEVEAEFVTHYLPLSWQFLLYICHSYIWHHSLRSIDLFCESNLWLNVDHPTSP